MTGFSTTTGVVDDLYGQVEQEFSDDDLNPQASAACRKPGTYHGHVVAVKMEGEDHEGVPSVARLTFEILEGTEPDQKGAKVYHRARLFKLIWDRMQDGSKARDATKVIGREAYGADYIKQAIRCAYALGLTDSPSLRGVDWESAVGRQCIFRVSASKDSYQKDGETKEVTRFEVGFGNFWRLDHPDVKNVPRDHEAIECAADEAEALSADDDYDDI